ncbi:hypothetical protein G436_2765 [Leptospira interrogans serovar Hardjo str. Norma]|uniref:Uncharacterized protein n=1 Tax=Leptospira interrogans serovar Hardjo str. Norma TaxID=1279460 RepID=A0A0M4NKV0_LEPIR|nr:hypothetical protein G436_2765 [Leptospira interrogans serovar Hardjo str. Norma]EKO98359.1 hypothetical protein LEP1GSC057_3149 [Leptospira interrogans str. Brem 329]
MNTTDSVIINFYFINCGSSHILEIEIPTFFRTMSVFLKLALSKASSVYKNEKKFSKSMSSYNFRICS